MTDEPSSKQPQPDLPGDPDSGLITAKELDDVLAQASTLATDLSDQLGDADGIGRAQANAPTDVDTELNEMEKLSATTSMELDGGSGAAHNANAETDPASPSSDPGAIPDFMSEFTEPQELTASAIDADSMPAPGLSSDGGADAAPTGAPPPRPGVIGPGLIGIVGTPPSASTEKAEQAPEEIEETEESPPSKLVGKSLKVIKSAGTRVGPLACGVGLQAVRVLERIDEPVSGMSQPVRRLLGWVAIATLGTSAVVYVISIL